ncbi:hypothetical protein PVA38_11335 [Streptococcus pneumoniae D39]|nr:hypothetical protein PVA38_11335 [Streptococcus pneumoniae D39]
MGLQDCLLYTSDAADEARSVDLGGRRIIKKKRLKKEERTKISTKVKVLRLQKTQSDSGEEYTAVYSDADDACYLKYVVVSTLLSV